MHIECAFENTGTVIVEAELEDGTVGLGTSIGGDPACYIIEKHLSRFVEGQVFQKRSKFLNVLFRMYEM